MKTTIQISHNMDGDTKPQYQEGPAQCQASPEPRSVRPSDSEFNAFPVEYWGSQSHKMKFHYDVGWELEKESSALLLTSI